MPDFDGADSTGAEFTGAEFTGERVVPGQVDPDLFNEHFSRYAFARRYARYKRVLDLGCGTGYGAAALAEVADHVTAVDSSADAIAYAKEHFARPNLTFEQGDATATPARYDLVTAFEVIEHLDNWQQLLHSAREAIDGGGIFLVSTPNKPVYAETRGSSGDNPFHAHEFEFEEFRNALAQVFPHVVMLVQNHSAGQLFAPLHHSGACEVALPSAALPGAALPDAALPDAALPDRAQFFLAVCALQRLEVDAFFWIPSTANLLHERNRHIALLSGELSLKTQWHEEARAELDQRNREFEQMLAARQKLQLELEERNRWALRQNTLLGERGERIEQLQAEVEASNANLAEVAAAYEAHTAALEQINHAKTEWAFETERRLTAELELTRADLARAVHLLHAAETTAEERTLWAQGLDRELQDWQARFAALRRSPWVRAGSRLRLIADRT